MEYTNTIFINTIFIIIKSLKIIKSKKKLIFEDFKTKNNEQHQIP